MSTVLPDIQDYSDYRKFLEDYYRAVKSKDYRFSHRFINQKVGALSSGWFADIVAGRQKLKPKHLTPLCAAFKFEPRVKQFLQVLVELESCESSEQVSWAYEKWFQLKGVRQEKLAQDKTKYFDKWYYPALRELLTLGLDKVEPDRLASHLYPVIKPNQVKQALGVLERLGLLLKGSPGSPTVLVKDSAIKTSNWKNIQKKLTQLSLSALQKFGKEERDFSALTLTLSPEGLIKAGEEISALRKRLLILSERDKNKNRVFQCLFQVYPLSIPVEKK